MEQICNNERFGWLKFELIQEKEKSFFLKYLDENTDFKAVDNPDQVKICKAKLEFYFDTWLIIIVDKRKNLHRNHCTEFLYQPSTKNKDEVPFIQPLYHNSPPIHSFNKERQSLNLNSKEDACAYLRFFCEAIDGEDGAFYVLDTIEYIPGHIKESEKEKIKKAFERQEELSTSLKDRIKQTNSGFEVEAATLYGNSLFASKYEIEPGGMVRMLDDESMPPATNMVLNKASQYKIFQILKKDEYNVLTEDEFKLALLDETSQEYRRLFQPENGNAEYETLEKKNILKITGNPKFTGDTIKVPLVFSSKGPRIIFEGNLIFNKVRFLHSVQLNNCELTNGILSFESSTIEGDLEMGNLSITSPIRLQNTPVLGLLNSQISGNLKCKSIEVIKGQMDISGSNIKGSVELTNSLIKRYFNLRFASIHKQITLIDTEVDGDVNCYAVQVGVTFSMYGSKVKGNVELTFSKIGSLFLRQVQNHKRNSIDGNLVLSGMDCKGGHVEIVGALIKGSVIMISPKSVGSLYLKKHLDGSGMFANSVYCEVGWGVLLSNLTLSGNLSLHGLKVGGIGEYESKVIKQGNCLIQNCYVKGDVDIFDSKNLKSEYLYFLKIKDKFFKIKGWSQDIEDFKKIKYDDVRKKYKNTFHEFINLNENNIVDYARFYLTHILEREQKTYHLVENDNILKWDSILNADKKKQISQRIKKTTLLGNKEGKFEISISFIDGNGFFQNGIIIIDDTKKQLTDHFKSELSEESLEHLELPTFKIIEYNPFLISLKDEKDSTVWTKVNVESIKDSFNEFDVSLLTESSENDYSIYKRNLPFFIEGQLIAVKDNIFSLRSPTIIHGDLNLSGIIVDGNIDLSNIKVGGEINLSQSKVEGNLSLKSFMIDASKISILSKATCSHLNISSIQLYRNIDLSGLEILNRDNKFKIALKARNMRVNGTLRLVRKKNSIKVSRDIDLGGSEITNIEMAGDLLPPNSTNNILLNLERVKVNYLDWREKVPMLVNTKMADLKVDTWSKNGIQNISNLLKAHSDEDHFKRNTYTEIERTLKNQGYEETAEEVYQEMWRRIKNQKIGGKKLKSKRYRFLCTIRSSFGYGSKPASISFIIFLIFIVCSTIIFSNPKNIIPTKNISKTFLSDKNIIVEDICEHPSKWGLGGGLWFTLRYNIPIVPFNAKSQWQPNTKEFNLFETRTNKFSVQSYAEIVEVLHWIIWTIFLIYLSGIIRRVERV